jgi:outer membrane lipoprotein SlyB
MGRIRSQARLQGMNSSPIRPVVIAALLAATGSGIGHADPGAAARGIVESVREVQLADSVGFPGVFEHAFKLPTADEVLVRLDDGRAIEVVHTGTRTFEAGERVQVVPDPKGVRIEPADDPTFLQP